MFNKPFTRRRYDIICFHSSSSNGMIRMSTRRTVRNAIQWGLTAFVLLVLFLWLGAEYEAFQVRQSPETLKFYQQPQVCGVIGATATTTITNSSTNTETLTASNNTVTATRKNPSKLTIATFPSQEDLIESGGFVGHCGSCGQCSNPHDIDIYDRTQNTLFESSTTCAKRALIWGRVTASKCLEEHVGFTSGCNDCWVENILCDLRKCIFTCLFYGMFGDVDGGAGTGTVLNACTQCDERRCGPDFIQCAGANRRRSGIVSDISRDEATEVCQTVSPDWWQDEELQESWRLLNNNEHRAV